ncbi:hypothetical protein [Paraburkholderia lacunae]|uniref:hypothetical protein n=1 Tax=Paraburkholderia lacunae TaxID=2211104 RepID=UPI0014035A6F|nr:hypothetical protein [Paraburkholderia lacunae]
MKGVFLLVAENGTGDRAAAMLRGALCAPRGPGGQAVNRLPTGDCRPPTAGKPPAERV